MRISKGKRFFFEKKKQKTFDFNGLVVGRRSATAEQELFAFFAKKETLPSLSLGLLEQAPPCPRSPCRYRMPPT
jgi:hypothetical protein